MANIVAGRGLHPPPVPRGADRAGSRRATDRAISGERTGAGQTAQGTTTLTLRPPTLADEEVCLAAHHEFEGFPFLLLWHPGLTWARYLERLDGLLSGADIPEGLVRSDLLLAEVGSELVGRVSIRIELNEPLAQKGGHVGYGVRPTTTTSRRPR